MNFENFDVLYSDDLSISKYYIKFAGERFLFLPRTFLQQLRCFRWRRLIAVTSAHNSGFESLYN